MPLTSPKTSAPYSLSVFFRRALTCLYCANIPVFLFHSFALPCLISVSLRPGAADASAEASLAGGAARRELAVRRTRAGVAVTTSSDRHLSAQLSTALAWRRGTDPLLVFPREEADAACPRHNIFKNGAHQLFPTRQSGVHLVPSDLPVSPRPFSPHGCSANSL